MHDSLEVITVSGVVSIDTVTMDWDHDSLGFGNHHWGNGSNHHGQQIGSMASDNQTMNHNMIDSDTTWVRPVYYLDVDEDGVSDYVLNFGPPWYVPEDSTLSRPQAGDFITVTGYEMTESMMWDQSVIIVTELNGQVWRDFDQTMPGFDRRMTDQDDVKIGSHMNFPNPFNPSTTISFQLLTSTNVTVTIHDVLGRKVATLMNTYATPGTYRVV
ncbi:MAG: T9SS type A sorting domain-containing protein, partial [FCB group bacterium]|nr:T9SS type A sorting domain-containing protein [FCB group bacterium]